MARAPIAIMIQLGVLWLPCLALRDEMDDQETSHASSLTNGAYSDVAVADLGLGKHTRQLSYSGGCWFLSFLEGLREKGAVRSLFATGLVTVKSKEITQILQCKSGPVEVDSTRYQWQTATGMTGWFDQCHEYDTCGSVPPECYVIPLWQQVLESIFVTKHGQKAKAGREFQKLIQVRMGGGKRADDMNGYLQLINSKITVADEEVFWIMDDRAKPKEWKQWVKDHRNPEEGTTALVFTLDRTSGKNNRQQHSMSVVGRPTWNKDWGAYFAVTWNQQKIGVDAENEFEIDGRKCKSSYADSKAKCDSVFLYKVSGLPPVSA